MAYLTPEEINTHLHAEIQNEISRDDEEKMQTAIDAAVEEVSSYLSNYDRTAIFAAIDSARNPIILLYCKDVAVWHFIQLANPNVDMALRERRYELASEKLKLIQSGKMNPNLPLPLPPEPPLQSGPVRYGNTRNQNKGYL